LVSLLVLRQSVKILSTLIFLYLKKPKYFSSGCSGGGSNFNQGMLG